MATNTTLRVQARGVVTLPKKMRTRTGISDGSVVRVTEQDGGIFIRAVSTLDPLLEADLQASLRDFRAGNFIEFSSIEEFHKKRKTKWGKSA